MYAIIQTGGKQYRLTPGDVVSLEKLVGDVGSKLNFDKVLLVGGTADQQTLVGAPYVAQASLEGEIVQQAKGEKLLTIKYRRRKGYRRTIGHRQELTRFLVTKISDGRGATLELDAAKRTESLVRASVPFSTREQDRAAKRAAASTEAPAKKKTAVKKAAPAKKSKE